MEPKVVSLKTHLKDVFIGHEEAILDQTRRTVIGALLERQIESLEGSKWKPNIRKAIDFFIAESLEVYDATCMPVRRARMLLKSLEMTYHMQDGADQTGLTDKTYIGDVAVEADRLLTAEVRSDYRCRCRRVLISRPETTMGRAFGTRSAVLPCNP